MREHMATALLVIAIVLAAYSVGRTDGFRLASRQCMDGIDRILEEVSR